MSRYVTISGKSTSTLTNYGRCLATMALHFNCSPLDLDKEQILDYLEHLKTQSKTPSSSYFKHTVYGLSFACRVMGKDASDISLPALKMPQKLPVVLSRQEVKQLIKAPELLKHRVLLATMYGCGLRRFELLNIKLPEVHLPPIAITHRICPVCRKGTMRTVMLFSGRAPPTEELCYFIAG